MTTGQLYRWRARAVFNTDKGPWLDTSPTPTGPTNNTGYMPGSAAGPVTFTWIELNPDNYSGAALQYVVQYSTSPAFPASTATVTLPAVTTLTRDTVVNPKIATTYYWRVKAQYNNGTPSKPTWVDISGWSAIQTFFNRYQSLTNVSFTQLDTAYGDPEPIRFLATNPNASLPVDAYYQVQFSTNSSFAADTNYWTFTRTATGSTPSARQYINGWKTGTYSWRIRIVNGNDSNATPITDWTTGPGTFDAP